MLSKRILELKEEEVRRLPCTELLDADVLALNDSRMFEIEAPSVLNAYTYGIRSRGWVGHIPIGEDLLVRILPKIAVTNLFGMLETAYNLRSFNILEGEIEIEKVEDLYERIVSILAQRVLDRARKGLYRNYIAQEEELAFVRGRIDPVATMLNISRGVPRLPCSYEEHTADIDDNRIPFWTLHQVRRQALRHQKVRRELDSARRALAGTIALEQRTASDCIERCYHRLNDDYVPMHGLCRFILEQSGPGIRGGDRTFIPFYLNMPGLFEKFVAEWLRQNRPSGVIVRAQHSALLDANFRFEIRTDIFLIDEKTGRHLAVLDTKYKSGEQPTEDDIHQLAFYANELQVDRAMLIYPSPSARQFRIRHGNRITLESLVFDVTAPLEQAGVKFLTELSHRLHLAE